MDKQDNNHEHCHDCGCGDHDHHHHEEEMDVIQLTLEDDSILECGVLGIFEVEDKAYIALMPLDEEEADNGALLYEYIELEDDEFKLELIEDEDEYNSVVDAFYALFSDGEIDYDYDE